MALQKRWDRLRAGLDLILDQLGADMADLPGWRERAALPRLQGQGKPNRLANCAATSGQAAEELGQWKTRVEEPRSPPRRPLLSWP